MQINLLKVGAKRSGTRVARVDWGDAVFVVLEAEARMYKMIAAMLTCALMTTLTVVNAQEPSGEKAKTQADIMRERAKACEGLKDTALQECLDNYVGPSRDATTGQAEQKTAPDTKAKNPAAAGAEHDGSSPVDMKDADKRAPVGPIKSAPGDEKK
jgi:hypothetical protein